MTTHLITGGAGFIGSNLTEALLARGDRVIVLDNFSIGSRENLTDLPQERLTIIEHDIRTPLTDIQDSGFRIQDSQINTIWNLACIASPAHYTKWPIETIETNTLGIPNVLKFALAAGAKVLHTSTSEVYGDPKEHPQKETYWGNVNPRGAHAMYKESKRVGETICTFYAQVHPELDVRLVRIFNTYGPKMALDDGRMLSDFLHRALTDRPIQVHGDGSQTRSTCYVSDLVAGLIAMMQLPEGKEREVSSEDEPSDLRPPTSDLRSELVNLGNPDEHTVQDFAETVVRLVGRGTIEHVAARSDDVKRRCPDITQAKALLGWQPTVDLETGLTKTIDWMRTKLT